MLEPAADLFAWLCAFDDLYVEEAAAAPRDAAVAPFVASFVRVVETFERPAAGAAAFTAVLGDVMGRLRDLVTPKQAERVGSRLVSLFLAMLWEGMTAGRSVGFAEYAAMRPHTVFGYVGATLIEPCAGLDPQAAVHARADVRRLLRATAVVWGWTNDVYSFAYEYQERGALRTLPWVLMKEYGLEPREAFARACRACEEEALVAHRLIGKPAASPVPELAPYAAALGCAIGGTERLYGVSGRWRTEGEPG
ncbi:terpene synthase family protein [Streptomyces sp. NPDC006197]|uniref:terpene synthase family protein n=1 Tax=Streptomyces sp. NPDC006197 TaxID=3156685 RepID=UPI0033B22563